MFVKITQVRSNEPPALFHYVLTDKCFGQVIVPMNIPLGRRRRRGASRHSKLLKLLAVWKGYQDKDLNPIPNIIQWYLYLQNYGIISNVADTLNTHNIYLEKYHPMLQFKSLYLPLLTRLNHNA